MPDWFSKILERARCEAIDLQQAYIRSEHLLLALIHHHPSVMTVSYTVFHDALSQMPKPSCGAEQKLTLAKSAQRSVNQAEAIGKTLTPQQFAQIVMASSPLVRRIMDQITEVA